MSSGLEAPLRRLFSVVDPHNTGFACVNDVSKILRGWGITLSSSNLDQIGRSWAGLEGSTTFGDEINQSTANHSFPHQYQIPKKEFIEVITFLLRVQKAFKEFESEGSGFISRAQAALVMRGFGGWNSNRIAIHSLAALFDSDSAPIPPQLPMEFDEFVSAMLSIRQLSNHFQTCNNPKFLISAPDMHTILYSFGTVLSVEELSMVLGRLKPEMYSTWRFPEFADFVANLASNVTKIRSVSARFKVEGRKDKGKAFQSLIKNVLLVDKSQTPRIIEKLNVDALKVILLQCRDSGTKFEDPDFKAHDTSLFGPNGAPSDAETNPMFKSLLSVVGWKRPCEISSNSSLFVTGPTEGDLDTGNLSNTWFLSALSMLTMSPNRNLSGIFLAKYPQFGLYQCRFSKDGEWHVVTVDDRLPVDASGRPAFARSRNPDEFWVSILEKAYAKLHGSYASIISGHTREALADLTGEVAEDSPLLYSSELWSMMMLNTKENWLMGCTNIEIKNHASDEMQQLMTINSSNQQTNQIKTHFEKAPGGQSLPVLGETSDCGILKNYTYSIMRCIEVGPYKLIQLHNPWGILRWRGRWSEGSQQWNEELKQKLGVGTFDDDGTFFMEFGDWCREFTHLHVLRLPSEDSTKPWEKISIAGEWRNDSAGGCTNFPSWTLNHQFKFTSSSDEPTTVFLSLSHKDRRMPQKDENGAVQLQSSWTTPTYPSHGLIVMKASNSEDNFKKDKASASDLEAINTFQNARDNSLEFTAAPNTSYIIVPATYQPGILGSYFLRIHSRHPAKVIPLMQLKANKSVEGSWQAIRGTNGGSIHYPSWRNNPQFLLRVFQEARVRITLIQQEMPILSTSTSSNTQQNDLPPIAFSIFKADPSERRKLDLADFILLPEKYIISASVSGDLTLPPGTYNIVASCETPEYENSFKLQIQGINPENGHVSAQANESIAIEYLREYKKIQLRDTWTVENAGGCRNHQTWPKNPHFLFTVPAPGGTITIVIGYTEIFKDTAIGCYLFSTDAKNARGPLLGKSKFTHVSVSTTFQLEAGNYILVPCTFAPGITKEFTVEFYTDLTISNIAKMKFASKPKQQ